MKKINHKILSIPPYISTSWKNINTLHVREIEGQPTLVVVLHNGSTIEIPNIGKLVVEQVFEAHSKYLEQDTDEQPSESLKQYEPNRDGDSSFSFGIPFQLGGGTGAMDHLGSMLQHNLEQSDAPDLPIEVIEKIAAISKALGMDFDQMSMAKAEPHCNCPYCQIARVIHDQEPLSREAKEEEVTAEDLQFRDWEIEQKGDKLFDVISPLDPSERYQVFLGSPVGCTCGEKNCEHIRYVLNS